MNSPASDVPYSECFRSSDKKSTFSKLYSVSAFCAAMKLCSTNRYMDILILKICCGSLEKFGIFYTVLGTKFGSTN